MATTKCRVPLAASYQPLPLSASRAAGSIDWVLKRSSKTIQPSGGVVSFCCICSAWNRPWAVRSPVGLPAPQVGLRSRISGNSMLSFRLEKVSGSNGVAPPTRTKRKLP
ncbi:hypothetical protein D3C76_1584640 [compost metagenome]